MCCQLSSLDKGGRSTCDKLDRRWSTKLTTPPSSGCQSLVYHSDRQAMSKKAQFRCAGLYWFYATVQSGSVCLRVFVRALPCVCW